METMSLSNASADEPENLIGTKWIAMIGLSKNKMVVEFVDKTNCVFTLKPNKCPMKYTAVGDKILFSELEGIIELRGRVLYNNNRPAFEKAA